MLDKIAINNIKPRFSASKFGLWLNAGWYPGDPFKLFDITVFEYDRNWKSKKIDWITIFSLQIVGHLYFGFGWSE